jgi:hypothetical protein
MEETASPKRRRGIYLLPNLFTTAALFAGFYAITAAINQRFELAAIAIFIAMVLDGMDGRVARLTNTQSPSAPSTTAWPISRLSESRRLSSFTSGPYRR